MTPEEMKTIRNRLDISQEKFAQLLGVSYATINRMETGKAEIDDPMTEKVSALCELLDKGIDKKEITKQISTVGILKYISAASILGIISAPVGMASVLTSLSAYIPVIGGGALLCKEILEKNKKKKDDKK